TFSHPNSLGPYLVPFIVLLVGGLGGATAGGRILRAAAAGGLAVLVALTYSRTAILVTATALFALPVLQARRFGLRGLVRGAAVTAAGAGLIWLLAGNLIRERFVNLAVGGAAIEAARSGISEDSFTWRVFNWTVLIGLGLEHPVTGH